ncbi:unnamed protein product [Mesocestoides corti]|uniref:Uncharacterized protein n=1 Tax=Mesocestoides corti TaxID=53468 RepID=A0A0R3UIW4_MESCO|nr:unnamed protein product [Mesocestoides corti]
MYCLQFILPIFFLPSPSNPAAHAHHTVYLFLVFLIFLMERKPCGICTLYIIRFSLPSPNPLSHKVRSCIFMRVPKLTGLFLCRTVRSISLCQVVANRDSFIWVCDL